MRLARRRWLQAALLGGLGTLLGRDDPGLRLYRRAGHAFGTDVSITVAAPHERSAEAALDAAFHEIRVVERAAALFAPRSEIARLNSQGRLDEPSPLLLDLLGFAAKLHDLSAGAFDCTIQPLWRCYADALAVSRLPTAEDLASACRRVDQNGLSFGRREVRLLERDMGVTLNALAQGYAADRVASVLRRHEAAAAFIDTGELGALGRHPEGRPWKMALAEEGNRLLPFSRPAFVATSADSKLSFTADRRLHHILDPRSARSPSELAAVTVVADSGLVADGLSTALMLVGSARAAALLQAFPGAAASLVTKDRRVLTFGNFPS